MRVETPTGSGQYVEIYFSASGNLVVSVQAIDCAGMRSRAAVELLGAGKGEIEPKIIQDLFSALKPFAS